MSFLPVEFLKRLSRIIPETSFNDVVETFHIEDVVCFRVNTLKASIEDVLLSLTAQGFVLTKVSWSSYSFSVPQEQRNALVMHPLMQEGKIYIQSFSSMLVPIILSVKKEDVVLDACAAPGSKTSQMSMMMENTGKIVAIEAIKNRWYKLRSVCSLLGVLNVESRLTDARRIRFEKEMFDAVLVDAPCSSEGRFKSFNQKTLGYWSPRKIKEMSHKQKGILLNAARGLKQGGALVYSTCSFAPEENEEVVDWFLRKTDKNFVLEPIEIRNMLLTYPALQEWNGHRFTQDVSYCLRITPTREMSGFFMAKFRKVLK